MKSYHTGHAKKSGLHMLEKGSFVMAPKHAAMLAEVSPGVQNSDSQMSGVGPMPGAIQRSALPQTGPVQTAPVIKGKKPPKLPTQSSANAFFGK